MPRPSSSTPAPDQAERRNARTILDRLVKRYPEMGTALDYVDPWQLLVATVLSAQTTDENVNKVTPPLFERWNTPEDLASADPEEVEQSVFSTGFYRQKTRSIIALSRDLVDLHGGSVPADLDQLIELRGVGRKTASVVLAEAFGMPAIAVDTHVKRLASLLDLTKNIDPVKIEFDLMEIVPKKDWSAFSLLLIFHGRNICIARRPKCCDCLINSYCPSNNCKE